jgi:hypothetical protein
MMMKVCFTSLVEDTNAYKFPKIMIKHDVKIEKKRFNYRFLHL